MRFLDFCPNRKITRLIMFQASLSNMVVLNKAITNQSSAKLPMMMCTANGTKWRLQATNTFLLLAMCTKLTTLLNYKKLKKWLGLTRGVRATMHLVFDFDKVIKFTKSLSLLIVSFGLLARFLRFFPLRRATRDRHLTPHLLEALLCSSRTSHMQACTQG